MFHHAIYTTTLGAAVTVMTDVPSVADTVFSQQNSHFIFTEQLKLLGMAGMGATLTQAQLYSPSLLPYGLLYNWPLNASATPPSYPRIMDFRDVPFDIPQNEQIQYQVIDGAAEVVTGHVWIAPPRWSAQRYKGQQRSVLQCTATITGTTKTWTGLNAITFTNPPRGGWYVVNAAWCLATSSRAFRLYFPRSPGTQYTNRQLRPGDLVSHASGDLLVPHWHKGLGIWGAFHSFEPPQLEMFADGAGALAPTLYLDVEYVGQGEAGGPYPISY